MLRLTRKLTLAVEAVVDVASHGADTPVQAQDIAARLGLPRRYLEQVMQQLVRASILRGVRGPRGGYRLGREPHRVSIGDIMRAVGNDDDRDASLGSASELGREVMAPFWASLEGELMDWLDSTTVDTLLPGRRATPHAWHVERQMEAAD